VLLLSRRAPVSSSVSLDHDIFKRRLYYRARRGRAATSLSDTGKLSALDLGSKKLSKDVSANLPGSTREIGKNREFFRTRARAGKLQHSIAGGDCTNSFFQAPISIAVDGKNNILVADHANHSIRMFSGEAPRLSTVAGSREEGKVDGTGASARFSQPIALVMDERGHLLVADTNRGCVRVVEASLEPPRQLLAANVLLSQVHARSPHAVVCLLSFSGDQGRAAALVCRVPTGADQ